MTKKTDYHTISQELEAVLADLQRPDVQVDEAVKLYERGLALAADLEQYLQEAENKVKQLKLQAGGDV